MGTTLGHREARGEARTPGAAVKPVSLVGKDGHTHSLSLNMSGVVC